MRMGRSGSSRELLHEEGVMPESSDFEERNPVAERYLAALNQSLEAMNKRDRKEIIAEIRAHFEDATTEGKPLDEVLIRLGPAETLAKAFLVESMLNPGVAGAGLISRSLGLVGLVVFGSLPTLLITTILGSFGLTFVVASPFVFAAGIYGFFSISLAPVIQTDLPPLQLILLGAAMDLFGASCLWGLYRYFQWLIKVFRHAIKIR